MKWTQAPPRDGTPAAAALSNVHTPSCWYTHWLVQGIRLMSIIRSERDCP
jgi:hypothetical protein